MSFVEVSTGDETILLEVVDDGGYQRVSGDRRHRIDESLSEVVGRIRPVIEAIAAQVNSVAMPPAEIVAEIKIGFSGEAKVVFVKATSDASITLRLTWKNDHQSTS
jgi:hypothetical protein